MLIGIALLVCLAAAVAACFACGFGVACLWAAPVAFVACFVVQFALGFLFLWFMCAIVDMKKPQEHDSTFYRVMTGLYIDAVATIVGMHIHKTGLEMVPKSGRFLLVSNHINDLDPVVLLASMRKSQLAFISKRENDEKFLVGKIMHKLLCQPINRENDREALKTILNCIRLLKEDEVSIGVFPEGYTSMDGLLHPFRSGVFKIAQKAKVPIVVCTLRDTNKVFPNIKKLKKTDVYLKVLTVIPPEEIAEVTAVELGNRIHEMMAADLGPERCLPAEENA